jgi:aminoglycoside phosphotransferase (APT) family kinase protein
MMNDDAIISVMPSRPLDYLPEEISLALLEKIAPRSRLLGIDLLPGSFSNHTHVVMARLPDGQELKCVVRRYQIYGDYDRGEKARREFRAFELMNKSGIPSPEPLLLDDTGALLGVPGIVTRFVEGHLQLDAPAEPLTWACKLAVMLARIHSIPVDKTASKFLLNANTEATWFLRGETPPKFMQEYRDGKEVWQTMREAYPHLIPVPDALVHIDYWSGNILWHAGDISAVLDWEEAACGDPTIDVAYARMNMCLMGLPQAAEEFLRVYEAERGCKAENLGLWEMAASARPMVDPLDWELDQSEMKERFDKYLRAALARVKD